LRIAFILGTAGSGKTLFTGAFAEWLKNQKQNVATLNLDPGALSLPYNPDIDIRESINLYDIMEDYGLGPNGAMILASDLIANEVESIRSEVESLDPDILIVDTPGQMEVFAFRASGPFIVGEIGEGEKAIVYLFDSVFSSNPMNYVSNLFLSAAVYNRFFTPQINVLSKCDLVPQEKLNQIVDWSASPLKLEEAIEKELKGNRRLLSRDLMRVIYRLGLRFLLIPVSAKTYKGMVNVNAAIERVLAAGDKYTTE